MMKKIAIFLIDLYQEFISVILKNILGASSFCRFKPTCSQYAKTVISERGIFKGMYLAAIRILRCQPYYKLEHDSL